MGIIDSLYTTVYQERTTATKADPKASVAGIPGSVADLLEKYRGTPEAIKAGIQAAIMAAVAGAAALSMIPFEANFGGEFAGRVLADLARPGYSAAITGPITDYLENIFPTRELNVRLLVTGLEKGALSDADVVETAVDAGIKNGEIVKLVKIAKIARFDRETADDYDMISRYQNALISAEIEFGRADIDQAITERYARVKELQTELRAAARAAAQAALGGS